MLLSTKSVEPADGTYRLSHDGDIIHVVLKGRMTGRVIQALTKELTQVAKTMRRPVVLADCSALRLADSVSSGRTEGRRMLTNVPVARWAFFGTSRIGTLVEYVGRAAGIGDKLHYFTDKRTALAWLRGEASPKPPRTTIGLVVGIIIGLIGIFSLIGWHINNPNLLSYMPTVQPMNPMAAIGLIALGAGFISYWLSAFKVMRAIGVLGVGLGVSALLPLNIDTLFFGDDVRSFGPDTLLADSAAVCFILSGFLGLLAGRKGKWVEICEYAIAGSVAVIAAINLYGQLYATEAIRSWGDGFSMALNLSLAFLVAAVTMIILVLIRQSHGALRRVSRSGWLIVVALVFVQAATYASWAQAKDRIHTESQQAFETRAKEIDEEVNVRLEAYVSALRGFRGLFAASSNVSQGDFDAYYSSLDLLQHYPGLRTIAFISAVKTADLPSFVATRKADDSLVPGGHPQFRIQNQTAEPLHFISTYVAGTAVSPSFGTDITSIPGRSAIYNAAFQASGYYSSGTVTFPANATQPATPGFFIATPVRTADNPAAIGVVTANFNYKDFFGSIIQTVDESALAISVTDSADGAFVYAAGPAVTGENPFTKDFTISLAQNQSWDVHVTAPANFGVTTNQTRLANLIVSSGHIFTILLGSIFVLQLRARGRALALADAVTEDLQIERDNIVALHKKDEAILAGLGEGLVVIDRFGKIEVTNAAAARMLGTTQEDMMGKSALSIMNAVDEKGQPIPDDKRPFERALKQKNIITTRLTYVRNDGKQIPVKLNVAPILLRDQAIGAIAVISDITKERQIEHMKDEFLSVASHELRTPMGAVRANLAMILNGDYGPVNKGLVEPLTDMKDSTVRLVELVNDLLNVARIEAGRLQFTLVDFPIAEAVRGVVANLAPLGKEKDVHISLTKSKVDAKVQADIDKMKQVLTNLIGNSLKFTDKGSIIVDIQVHKDMAEVTVTDTGIGITSDDQNKLFSKFKQITTAQDGKPAGTGLGLYISREVVRKMGGDMWIKESVPGKGSTFVFTVPLSESSVARHAKKSLTQEANTNPDQK